MISTRRPWMGKKIPRKRMGKMKGPRESRNSKRVRKLAGRGVKHFYHKLHALKVAKKGNV